MELGKFWRWEDRVEYHWSCMEETESGTACPALREGEHRREGDGKLKTHVTFFRFIPGALGPAASYDTENPFKLLCLACLASWASGLACYVSVK